MVCVEIMDDVEEREPGVVAWVVISKKYEVVHDNLLLPSISGRSVGPGRREGLGRKGEEQKCRECRMGVGWLLCCWIRLGAPWGCWGEKA